MSQNPKNDTSKPRGPSVRRLLNMSYMEILENYLEYPQPDNIDSDKKHLYKYKYLADVVANPTTSDNINVLGNIQIKKADKPFKTDFLSESDKAEGWIQKFSTNKKFSKFLQTNLHYLPEHLWSKMKPFYQDNVHVGYKVNDGNVHFFVHCADSTDEITKTLYSSISKGYNIDKQFVSDMILQLEEKGIDSWLTMRAKSLLT